MFSKSLSTTLIVLVTTILSATAQDTTYGKVPIRFTEQYGSVCCPRDIKHDHPLSGYIRSFNKINHTRIKDIYHATAGREGEKIYWLSLKELSVKLRNKFLRGRMKYRDNEQKQAALKLLKQPEPLSVIAENNTVIKGL